MDEFSFQSDRVAQLGWHVDRLEPWMERFTRELGAGPWFLMDRPLPPGSLYRGAPTTLRVRVAFGFIGTVQYELIEQLDDEPSVYRDHQTRTGGYGLHHWGILTDRFEEDVAAQEAKGRRVEFSVYIPDRSRLAYFDTQGALPAMIELIEANASTRARFEMMYAAARDWDGRDPVRLLA